MKVTQQTVLHCVDNGKLSCEMIELPISTTVSLWLILLTQQRDFDLFISLAHVAKATPSIDCAWPIFQLNILFELDVGS
jgi:hypothetical protein